VQPALTNPDPYQAWLAVDLGKRNQSIYALRIWGSIQPMGMPGGSQKLSDFMIATTAAPGAMLGHWFVWGGCRLGARLSHWRWFFSLQLIDYRPRFIIKKETPKFF